MNCRCTCRLSSQPQALRNANTMVDFRPAINARFAPGLVLRIGLAPSEFKYLRITHVWEDKCVYGMWIGEPREARNARRPSRKSWREFSKLALEYGSVPRARSFTGCAYSC